MGFIETLIHLPTAEQWPLLKPLILLMQLFVYRLLEPQRCSFSIGPHPRTGQWQLVEIAARFNKTATKKAVGAVNWWLEQFNTEPVTTRIPTTLPAQLELWAEPDESDNIPF